MSPKHTHIDENNYNAINTTYQQKWIQNRKQQYYRQLVNNINILTIKKIYL